MQFYRRSWISAVEFVGAGAALFPPRSRRRHWPACFLLALSSLFAASPLNAALDMYVQAELEAGAVRLRNAIIRIYEIGLKPSMTAAESQAVGDFEFTFPLLSRRQGVPRRQASRDPDRAGCAQGRQYGRQESRHPLLEPAQRSICIHHRA